MDNTAELLQIQTAAKTAVLEAKSLAEVRELEVKYVGRKSKLNQLLKSLKDLPPSERAEVGKLANQVNTDLHKLFEKQTAKFTHEELDKKLKHDFLDVTMPGMPSLAGELHPI